MNVLGACSVKQASAPNALPERTLTVKGAAKLRYLCPDAEDEARDGRTDWGVWAAVQVCPEDGG